MIAIATALGGCGGTSLLHGSHSFSQTVTSRSASASHLQGDYLARLEQAQRKLAAAEARLPRRAKTPAALARAITLLRSAIDQLGHDLAALAPPPTVRGLHARLVDAVRRYAASLGTAARTARSAGGAAKAAAELVSATSVASRNFSSAIAQIDRRLTP
jgi:hypothetical protein